MGGGCWNYWMKAFTRNQILMTNQFSSRSQVSLKLIHHDILFSVWWTIRNKGKLWWTVHKWRPKNIFSNFHPRPLIFVGSICRSLDKILDVICKQPPTKGLYGKIYTQERHCPHKDGFMLFLLLLLVLHSIQFYVLSVCFL